MPDLYSFLGTSCVSLRFQPNACKADDLTHLLLRYLRFLLLFPFAHRHISQRHRPHTKRCLQRTTFRPDICRSMTVSRQVQSVPLGMTRMHPVPSALESSQRGTQRSVGCWCDQWCSDRTFQECTWRTARPRHPTQTGRLCTHDTELPLRADCGSLEGRRSIPSLQQARFQRTTLIY